MNDLDKQAYLRFTVNLLRLRDLMLRSESEYSSVLYIETLFVKKILFLCRKWRESNGFLQ